MPWDIAFYAYGDNFLPSTIDYPFTRSKDPGGIEPEVARISKRPMPYGWAEVRVPRHVHNRDRITYIARITLELLPEIKRAGATEWYIDIARYYTTQCNEDYSPEELALLAQLACPLLYSAYQVSEEEEIEMDRILGGYESDDPSG